MKVMVCAPHPDDEIMCAGTLAKYAMRGHETAIVFVTNGEGGSEILNKKETALVREKEARASASVINADFFWLGFPDGQIYPNEEVRLRLLDVIRQFKPDIIICPDKDNDYHPDHVCVGQIVWDVRVLTTVPNISTSHARCEKIPDIYYMDTVAGVNFYPEIYVDITDFWDKKSEMLSCHKSQHGWLEAQYDIGCEDFSRTQAKFRGFQCGSKYAEAFRKPKFFPSNQARDFL